MASPAPSELYSWFQTALASWASGGRSESLNYFLSGPPTQSSELRSSYESLEPSAPLSLQGKDPALSRIPNGSESSHSPPFRAEGLENPFQRTQVMPEFTQLPSLPVRLSATAPSSDSQDSVEAGQ